MPGRLVRHRTDQRVVDVLARADIADHRQAGMQAKARAKARPAELAPFLGKLPAGGGGLQGRAAGIDDMVGIRLRRVPEGHDAVADVLVDGAVVDQDRRSQRIEIARQPAGQQLGLHGLADPREALDVGEHHRDLAPPAADAGGLGRAHDLVHEVLRHVAAEHLQPLAHALDRIGQAHDLGDAALDPRAVGEIEVADALGLGGDARDRARQHRTRRAGCRGWPAPRPRSRQWPPARSGSANRPTVRRSARRRRPGSAGRTPAASGAPAGDSRGHPAPRRARPARRCRPPG